LNLCKLVSMMVLDTFALGSENSFGALPPDNFESNVSVVFTKSGHELLTFYFDDRADQVGVKGRLTDRFYGQVRYYKMREIATFPKDLRELARRSKVTERDEGGC
jgi:hypothetical protein